MIAGTLFRYFGLRFLSAVFAVFAGAFVLVTMVDFIEMLRRTQDLPDVPTLLVAKISPGADRPLPYPPPCSIDSIPWTSRLPPSTPAPAVAVLRRNPPPGNAAAEGGQRPPEQMWPQTQTAACLPRPGASPDTWLALVSNWATCAWAGSNNAASNISVRCISK